MYGGSELTRNCYGRTGGLTDHSYNPPCASCGNGVGGGGGWGVEGLKIVKLQIRYATLALTSHQL